MDDRDLVERARIVRLLRRIIANQQVIAKGTNFSRGRDARAAVSVLTEAIEAIEAGEHHGVSDVA